jgi:GNAT superfamily N-acetyltransferase
MRECARRVAQFVNPHRSKKVPLRYAELAERDIPAMADFTCGDEEWHSYLNDFLKEDALEQAEARFNKTYVFYAESSQLVAYVALSASEVRNQEGEATPLLADSPYGRIPALLIGRLAVDGRYQGQGLGSEIMAWVRSMALGLSIGCRFLALHVDTRNTSAIGFYCKQGFFKPPHLKVRGGMQLMLYDLVASEDAPD